MFVLLLTSGSGRDVGVSVHEALHCWRDVPTPPGLLPASPQQLLRLLWSVPAPRRLGRPWPQSFLHLLWGFSPDELLHLPGSAQMSRVRTNVVLALLRSILDQAGFWRKISDHSAVIHFLTSLLQASWLFFCWFSDSLPVLFSPFLWSRGLKLKLKVSQFFKSSVNLTF